MLAKVTREGAVFGLNVNVFDPFQSWTMNRIGGSDCNNSSSEL